MPAIIAVNATRAVVQGLPAVASVLDVAEPIDLAVVAVPAPAVLDALKQCVTRRIPAAVVISAGFREAGAEGRAREAELRAWLAEASAAADRTELPGLDPSRAPAQPHLRGRGAAGRQPGLLLPLGRAVHRDPRLVTRAQPRLLALRQPGQPGRRNETDLIQALADDPETRVILGYLEGVADGRAFFAALVGGRRSQAVRADEGRTLARGRPRRLPPTPARWRAPTARSTPPCARPARCASTSLEELFDVARALVTGHTPPGAEGDPRHQRRRPRDPGDRRRARRGPRRGAAAGAVQARLAAVLPPHAATTNPVDLIGDATPSRYGDALHALAGSRPPASSCCRPRPPPTPRAWRARCWAPRVTGRLRCSACSPAVLAFGPASRPSRRPACRATPSPSARCGRSPTRWSWPSGGGRRAATTPPFGVDRAQLTPRRRGARRRTPRTSGRRAAPGRLRIDVVPARLARSPAEAAEVTRSLGAPVAIKIVSPTSRTRPTSAASCSDSTPRGGGEGDGRDAGAVRAHPA